MIRTSVERIKSNIATAAAKTGRAASDITLIGVTKTIDVERMKDLLLLGVCDFGENRVQELMDKYPLLPKNISWHMIGHLQTNKVKYIIDKVQMVQSVDSIRIGSEISKYALKNGLVMDVLAEINIAGEASKSGVMPEDAVQFVSELCKMEGIHIRGLMTVAPFVEIPDNNRECFKKMYNLFIDIRNKIHHNVNMDFLSMGMTNDYEVAIEEGANMVRIGTGIFGERHTTV